ncbi:hypothetical protein [Nitratifractor sp.]
MFSIIIRTIVKITLLSVFLHSAQAPTSALRIDPLPEKPTLTDMFNTNCLQMTQSQQMPKAYIMKGLGSTFDDPAGALERAVPAYDRRFVRIKSYFQKRLQDHPEAI